MGKHTLQQKQNGARKSAGAGVRAAGKKPKGPPPVWMELLYLILRIASVLLIFAALFTFVFGAVRYDEPSMAPMIKDGDLVVYYRYTDGYIAQDVVMLEFEGKKQARRVVASAGDVVDIEGGGLIVNGARLQELEIYQRTERYEEGVAFPLTVPEGCVFVLGDSRQDATDSRIYGCVRLEDTLGKVMAVLRRRGI